MPSLRICLHGREVGTLRKDERTRFSLMKSYLDLPRRPVLGQAFEENLRARRSGGGGRLPPFFSNMLPEGALRVRLAKALGVNEDDEFAMLAATGDDLPGAVTAIPADDLHEGPDALADEEEAVPSPPRGDQTLRFSLAGVQLKLSMLREGERLTVPASGKSGDWIVKLPSPTFPFLPENEHATMTWASHAGIRVAEHTLISMDLLQGVPQLMMDGVSDRAFATKRYDRTGTDRRIQQEDFAQVLDVYPERKYDAANFETIANVVLQLGGMHELRELVRRMVFVVLCGNGDAHLKNWSLVYPDDVRAELSPAYDLVSTIHYLSGDKLALNLARSKLFEDVSAASFARLARKLNVEESDVLDVVRESVTRTLEAWQRLRRELAVPEVYRTRVDEHLDKLPLARLK